MADPPTVARPGGLKSGYSVSLPIYLANERGDGCFELVGGQVMGTCFSIGSDFFVTAGHVVEALGAAACKSVVTATDPLGNCMKAGLVVESEVLPNDIGLLRVHFADPAWTYWFHALKWSLDLVDPFRDVRVIGYAYGLHEVEGRKYTVARCFKGHIVAPLNQFKPLGSEGEPFSVYELSFQAPRGLSGSALLGDSSPIVHGVVIGNSQYSMLVHASEDHETSESTTLVYERYESLALGIAVQAQAIAGLNSSLLGSTLREHLSIGNLLL